MTHRIAELYRSLNTDPERPSLGFSPDMEEAQRKLFEATSDQSAEATLSEWINRFQPCLFGRLSAKLGRIEYCILREDDLVGSDQAIADKIQAARLHWMRAAFEGRKSGFIILSFSRRLADASPDSVMREFAQRLCSLYLLEDEIRTDVIYTDATYLEKPGVDRMTWKWLVGVNFFSASADQRWWQDHRIPGGIGFSMNSVGHLVKSGILARALQQFDELLGASSEPLATTKIDSLEKALEFAMRTIWGASTAVSGKATELLPLPHDLAMLPVSKCPAELPRFLVEKNYCTYQGYYHTDVTLPSDYFLPDVKRPQHVKPIELDFTYLFRRDIDNPAFKSMGEGSRIRGEQPAALAPQQKVRTAEMEEVAVDSVPRLMQALGLK